MPRPFVAMAALAIGVLLAAPAAFAQNLVPCAPENGFCRVPYPTRVVYGVPGRSAALDVRDRGIPCSNQVFGDPAPGTPKHCAYIARGRDGGGYDERRRDRSDYDRPSRVWPEGDERRAGYDRPDRDHGMGRWRTCASEDGFCNFQGRMRVRYGASGRYAEGTFRNGVDCNNGTFGDSAPGMRKVCQVLN